MVVWIYSGFTKVVASRKSHRTRFRAVQRISVYYVPFRSVKTGHQFISFLLYRSFIFLDGRMLSCCYRQPAGRLRNTFLNLLRLRPQFLEFGSISLMLTKCKVHITICLANRTLRPITPEQFRYQNTGTHTDEIVIKTK